MSVKNKINSINLWLKKNTSIDEQILSIKKFEIGQSNPTFLLKSHNKSFVLRSKPLGNLLRGAHRIDREYKVMSALSNSKIPTPKMYGYCSDEDITGSEFYVMEFINGAHEFDPDLTNYTSEQRDKIYKHKIKIFILIKIDIFSFNSITFRSCNDCISLSFYNLKFIIINCVISFNNINKSFFFNAIHPAVAL